MTEFDEPVLKGMLDSGLAEAPHDPAASERIRTLLCEQPYGVLCTQGGGQPYGSLVAFAANDDLNALVFATPVTTRKYRLLFATALDSILSEHTDVSYGERRVSAGVGESAGDDAGNPTQIATGSGAGGTASCPRSPPVRGRRCVAPG